MVRYIVDAVVVRARICKFVREYSNSMDYNLIHRFQGLSCSLFIRHAQAMLYEHGAADMKLPIIYVYLCLSVRLHLLTAARVRLKSSCIRK